MKKSVFISCFMAFVVFSGFAQINHPIVNPDNRWGENEWNWGGQTLHRYSFCDEDTTIEGRSFLKLRHDIQYTSQTWPDPWVPMTFDVWLHEENGKVWEFNVLTDTLELLYDFTVAQGDTGVVNFVTGLIVVPHDGDEVSGHSSESPFVVDSIFQMEIAGELRKVMDVRISIYQLWPNEEPAFNVTDRWVEGIGSMRGLLNRGSTANWPDYGVFPCNFYDAGADAYLYDHDLVCMELKDFERCSPILGLKKEIEEEALKVVPNPALDWAHVQHSRAQNAAYRIMKLGGESEKSGQLNGSDLFVGDLAPGLYLLEVTLNDGQIRTEKLVVER